MTTSTRTCRRSTRPEASYRFGYLEILGFLATIALAACSSSDLVPPSAAIVLPLSGSPVTGTVPVQISATDDRGVRLVELYARGKSATGPGVLVGSSVESPFVVAWNTLAQPNASDLELVAVATDFGGNQGESPPVPVRTQNSGVPNVERLYAFTVPVQASTAVASSAESRGSVLPVSTPSSGAMPPSNLGDGDGIAAQDQRGSVVAQAMGGRSFALEWQLSPFTGADGYGLYVGSGDLAGPYDLVGRYSAPATSGSLTYSVFRDGVSPGDAFFGVATAVTGGATVESGFSNADAATFLAAQSVSSPADGAALASGRPTLSWVGTPGAVGYLYYVYDKDPWASDATLLWSNYPNTVSDLSATYPVDLPALASGTYYWWVAGVSFDQSGKADGFTFSDPRAFTVP